MAVEMDYKAISYSPNSIASAATGFGYSKMAFVANSIAIFIRSMDYDAAPSGNDTGLSIPLALGNWDEWVCLSHPNSDRESGSVRSSLTCRWPQTPFGPLALKNFVKTV